MRAFKIWNKDRTSSFNLSGLNVITTNVAGLGNKFTNDLYDGRIKKHLISQTNSFEQINLTVNFGVHSNAYQKYRDFMNFIQANGRNILVIEYYTPGTSRFVDVVLSGSTKSQKTNFNVLVETVTFDRLTPYYILQRRTGKSVLVSNRYLENVVPRLELKNNLYPTGTKIRVKSKNEGMPDLSTAIELPDGNYNLGTLLGVNRIYNVYSGVLSYNGTLTSSNIILNRFNVGTGAYTLNLTYLSGGVSGTVLNIQIFNNDNFVSNTPLSNGNNFKVSYNFTGTSGNSFRIVSQSNGFNYDNYQFKLQIEKTGNNLELDRPIDELNDYTLREVFERRNMAMPILTGKTEISTGVYRLYNAKGITIDYNVTNGEYTLNGTAIETPSYTLTNLFPSGEHTLSYIYVSGQLQQGNIMINNAPEYNIGFRNYTYDYTDNKERTSIQNGQTQLYIQFFADAQVDNFTFKLQLEKGSTATPYQVPTSGPYNTFDISTLGLTSEQINYYDNLYNTLLTTPTEYSKPVTTTQEIELNESILVSQTLVIDSENKTVTLNGANAYQITNKDKSTFLNLPEGDYLVECDAPIAVEYKRWVID